MKLFTYFLIIVILVGTIGYIGYSNIKLINTEYNEATNSLRDKLDASVEASSYAKRTEGHLLLALMLDTQSDRDKFPLRHASLNENINLLDMLVTDEESVQQVEKIKTHSKNTLKFGTELLREYDKNFTAFEPTEHLELISLFHDATTDARKTAIAIAKRETEITDKKFKELDRITKKTQLLIFGFTIISIMIIIGLGMFVSYKITSPLENLSNLVNQISKGNFNVELKRSKGIKEISVLEESLSRIIISMKIAVKKVEGLKPKK